MKDVVSDQHRIMTNIRLSDQRLAFATNILYPSTSLIGNFKPLAICPVYIKPQKTSFHVMPQELTKSIKTVFPHIENKISINNSTIKSVCQLLKVKRMQRPGTEAIRTQLQPSKPKQEIIKITNGQNTKRTYGQQSEQLFPKRWPLSYPNLT